MSSDDRKEPEAVWHGAADAGWSQASEQSLALDAEELAAADQPVGTFPPGTPVPGAQAFAADNVDEFADPPESAANFLQKIWHYVTLIVIPLLLAGLTCALVLPRVLGGHAFLPSSWFWPITTLIVIIAILQGILIYSTSDILNMWIVVSLGGFFFFLLVGCLMLFGLLPSIILLIALVILIVYMLPRSFHPVPEGVVDIVFAHGKYSRTLESGFNLLAPWEEVTHQVNIEEIHWLCPPQKIQLSPAEDVVLRALISYQILPQDAPLAVTEVNNWEESLRELFISMLHTISTVFTPNDFVNWPRSLNVYQAQQGPGEDDFTGGFARREQINMHLYQLLSQRVRRWGVHINWVTIRDIEVAPHGMAAIYSAPIEADAHHEHRIVISEPVIVTPTPDVAPIRPGPREEPVLSQEPTQVMSSVKILDEVVLKNLYKQVQDGKVTDPVTIRSIAKTFEAAALDPNFNQTIQFDAGRAALILFERANKYDELYALGLSHDARGQENNPQPHR